MSIEPEHIPAVFYSYTPRLVEDLGRTFGDLFPRDRRVELVETTLEQVCRTYGGNAEGLEQWIGEQVRQRALAFVLDQPRPPAFSLESERLLACLLHLRHPEALALLMTYGPRLERYVANKYPSFSFQEREDIVSDALLRVYEKGPEFDPERSKVNTWLTTHVTYRALDDLRLKMAPADIDRLADRLVDERGQPEPVADERPSPELMALIERLSPQRAKALLMHYFDGMSFEAIARALNTSEVTVRAHLSRARKDLERLMGDNMTMVRRVVPVLLALVVFVTSQAVAGGPLNPFAPVAVVAPSAAPTHSPSLAATNAPQRAAPQPGAPQAQPSVRPTGLPPSATPLPTSSPTRAPTGSPTSSPTPAPATSQAEGGPPPAGGDRASVAAVPSDTPASSPTDAPSSPTPPATSTPSTQPTSPARSAATATSAPVSGGDSPELPATATPAPSATPLPSSSPTPPPTASERPTSPPPSATSSPTASPAARAEVPTATSSPTQAPTSSPTEVPTSSPTDAATATPSPTPEATQAPAAPDSCAVYGIHDSGDGAVQLVTIDIAARTAQAHGALWEHSDIRDIAVRASSGALYAASGDEGSSPGSLYRVDLTTGELSLVGSTGFKVISAIAFNSADDTLWAWVEGEGLFRLDPETAAAAPVYPSRVRVEGLAWSADGSRLYGSAKTDLWVYAEGTLSLAATNLPGITQAIWFNEAGQLVGTFHETSAFTIYSYDLLSRQTIGSVSIDSEYEDIDALAWPASCSVPTP